MRKFESFGKLDGLVVGPWGEASKDLHSLIRVLGESRVAATVRSEGRPASDNELGGVIGQIRRVLSTTFVRSQSLCLLARVCHLGSGAPAAADRRAVTRRQMEARKKESEAAYWAHVRGRGLSFVGQTFQ